MYRTIINEPLDHSYETDLNVLGGNYSIDALRVPFFESHYSQLLADQPLRYDLHYWDDMDKFREMLGADMDPVAHGPYQARTVAIPTLLAQEAAPELYQLTTVEAAHFVAYHVVHDDHEGITGDVALPFKTDESDLAEQEIWERMTAGIYGYEESAELRHYAGQFTAKNSDFFLPKIWDVTERMGYVYTGLQAWRVYAEEADLTSVEREKALIMASDVCSRSVAKVANAREEIAFADEFMISFSPVFGKIADVIGVGVHEFVMEGAGKVEFKQ